MTNEMSEVRPTIEIPKFFTISFMVFLMAVGIFLSGALLNWTITNKFSSIVEEEPSQITAQIRESQLTCLARNIYFEAGGEPFEGKVAVAQVTLNRAASGQFPSDICQVIYQKNIVYDKVLCQFSWYCDRSSSTRPINKVTYDESMIVAKKVLMEGFRLPSLEQALYFHADYIDPGWKRQKVAKVGRHIFYR
jgi:spore germination cell wall hydrolase CwlJ-like protein